MAYLLFLISCAILLPLQVYIGGNSFKDRLEKLMGSTLFKSSYRFLYISLSIAIYFVCLQFFLRMPETVLFSWQDSVSNLLFLILDTVRFVALFLIIEAIWELDLFEFLGFKQFWYLITKKDISRFKRNRIRWQAYIPKGLYLRHRQPVFFYIILFFLLDRSITMADLLFLVVFIPYFHINSSRQEARLLEDYGDSYHQYKRSVHKYWPLMKRYSGHEKPQK